MAVTRTHRFARWSAWLSVIGILLATLSPWLGIAPMRIPAAWCLICGGAWVMDAVSNVLLFAPLGASLAGCGWRLRRVLLGGVVLSLCVETLQSFGIPPQRSPSVSDLLTNATGALLGALLLRHWRRLLAPSPHDATAWSRYATLGTSLVFVGTALALLPRPAAHGASATLRVSPFDYAPGYGWYDGRLSQVMVNTLTVPHDGVGPVVVTADAVPDSLHIAAMLGGRDPAWYTRAMVFVHPADDTLPAVSLSQRGTHLELHIERRGSDWGLYMPYVRLAHALRDGGASDTRPRAIDAYATLGTLTLIQHRADGSLRRTIPLAGTSGWAMLQSVVGPTHRLAPVIQALWLMVLCAPIGWWSGRTRTPVRTASLAAALITTALIGSAWWVGIAWPPPVDWMTMGAALTIATLSSLRSRGNELPRAAPPSGYIAG